MTPRTTASGAGKSRLIGRNGPEGPRSVPRSLHLRADPSAFCEDQRPRAPGTGTSAQPSSRCVSLCTHHQATPASSKLEALSESQSAPVQPIRQCLARGSPYVPSLPQSAAPLNYHTACGRVISAVRSSVPYHSGTVSQPGNGPTSSFQPVEDSSSRTTRRLVRVLSLAMSSSCERLPSGYWTGQSPTQRGFSTRTESRVSRE